MAEHFVLCIMTIILSEDGVHWIHWVQFIQYWVQDCTVYAAVYSTTSHTVLYKLRGLRFNEPQFNRTKPFITFYNKTQKSISTIQYIYYNIPLQYSSIKVKNWKTINWKINASFWKGISYLHALKSNYFTNYSFFNFNFYRGIL